MEPHVPTSCGMPVEQASISGTRRIFNDNLGISPLPNQSANTTTFPMFPRLPSELRLHIWRLCFPPTRIISLYISQPGLPRRMVDGGKMELVRGFDHEAFAPRMHYKTRNSLGNIVSSYPYHINVPRFEQWSRALMGVNRESREVFLSFYRITIPTHHLNGDPEAQIYVNPDTDILEMQLVMFTPAVALVAFLHDALANDPAGRGIAHLALGRGTMDMNMLVRATTRPKSENGGSARAQNPFSTHSLSLSVHPVAAVSMRKWLQTGLCTFYSVIQPMNGRKDMYPRADDAGRFHLNRSLPLATLGTFEQATEYSSVGPDPRAVEEGDLASVVVRVDPREAVNSWYSILDNLGVDKSNSVMQVRYLLAMWPSKWRAAPTTRQEFVQYLDQWDASFAKLMVDLNEPPWDDINEPPWGDRLDEETWRRQLRDFSDVAGIWVLDADALGEAIPSQLQQESTDESDSGEPRPIILKGLTTPRPELFVCHLP